MSVLKPEEVMGNEKPGRTHTPRIVEIEWVDALAIGGDDWTDDEEVTAKGMPSKTVGYVIHESEEAISVVSLVNLHHYGHGITIPKGCVTKVRTLK